MKKIKLFVAIPSMGNVCDTLIHLFPKLEARYGDEIEFIRPKHCTRRMFHDYARNLLVQEFLESDADIIWFLDSDVSPREDVLDLITIYGDRWKIAGCPYPVFMSPKEDMPQKVVFTVYGRRPDGGMYHTDCPHKGTGYVAGIATGCIFIHREVLEKMQKPYFDFTFDPETKCITQGEDLGFCKKVSDLGYQFFIDFTKVCNHYKTVGLLDVANYATTFARDSLEGYKMAVVEEMKVRAEVKHKKASTIWTPNA